MSLEKLLQQVQEKGQDQSVATTGGDYTPPAEGQTGARLVAYYEVGQHENTFEGKKKVQDQVVLVFELIGKKHPPKEINGVKVPVLLEIKTNLSTNEKATYFKIFSRLRTEEKHAVQLLGKPVILNVVHKEKELAGSKKRIYANIDSESIRKPIIQVPELEDGEPTGNLLEQVFPVGPALSELKAFVWDFANATLWDSIYIPGEYPERKDESGKVTAEAKSKNVIQMKIASALNFKGLACYDYAASKLVGGEVTREGVDALDDAVGDVSNAKAEDGPPWNEEDPMAGVD